MIYKNLPEGYQLVNEINLKNNKKELFLINILALLALVPFYFGLGLIEASFNISFLGLLAFLICYGVTIIVHEIIHAIFFNLRGKVKVQFKFHGFAASAGVPGIYFQKKHYMIVALAPFIIISLLLLPLLFLFSGYLFYFVYFLLAFHFSGCVGDFYVVSKLLKMPRELLVEDSGIGMKFFQCE